MTIERAALTIAEIDKAKAGGLKAIKGWASSYDNVDRVGRIMKAGAFGSTLGGVDHGGKSFASFKVPLLGYHEDTLPVGQSDMQPQAAVGMRHESGLADTAFARDMAALVDAGAIPATSIGWDTFSAVWTVNKAGFKEFTYIDVMENSLCPCPANPYAILDAASYAGSGAAPVWEKDVPQSIKDLWPDFARMQFGPPEVIDLSRTAKLDRDKAAGKRHSDADQGHIQTAHDALVSAGASCDAGEAAGEHEGAWDPHYRNALPDAAFAVVLPGGTKDSAGLTIPRSLRKLPYRDAAGVIDKAQLRLTLARVERIDMPAEQRTIAKKALVSAASHAGLEMRDVAALVASGRSTAAVQGSFEEQIDLLRQALNAAYPQQWPWVRATYPDAVVYELDEALGLGAPAGTYRVSYTVDPEDGDIEFGVPEPVRLQDVVIPIGEDADDDRLVASVEALELDVLELEASSIV